MNDNSNQSGNDEVLPDSASDDLSNKEQDAAQPVDDLDSTFQVAKQVPKEERKQIGRFPFRLNCPHCHEPIVVTDDGLDDSVVCVVCGSTFRLDRDRSKSWSPEKLPVLGKFKLLEAVGRGAFGTVYRAQDTQLNRIVAVKIPRSGTFVTNEDTERFEREARHVATLNHPGIVPVYEVGQEGEFPFIVAEFVDGVTVGEILGQGRIGTAEAAYLMADIADAVHHAHEHGIVHRDLKPSNVLLERRPADAQDESGSSPGSGSHSGIRRTGIARQFRPRVMDFGLARHEAGEFTVTLEGQILGTPAYMSPEQARGHSHDADRRSDTYSLGVMLYVMLTGELPFRGSVRMLMQQVMHDEPPSLRKLNHSIPRDLETICLKCLQKDPDRRYGTAAGFRDDLLRFVNHEPIQARPVSRPERLWRWIQRKPVVAGLTAAVAVSLIAGTVISATFAVSAGHNAKEARANADRAIRNESAAIASAKEAEQNAVKAQQNAEKAEAEEARARKLATVAQEQAELASSREFTARWSAYVPGMRQAYQDWADGYTGKAIEELKKHVPEPGQNDLRGFEWGLLWKLTQGADAVLRGHKGPVLGVAVSADGKLIASCGADHTVRLWDAVSGKLRVTLNAHAKAVHAIAFSPDGKLLASASDDQTVKLWDTSAFREQQSIYAGTNYNGKEGPRSLKFSTESTLLALGFNGNADGIRIFRKKKDKFQEWLSTGRESTCLEFQKDSQILFSGTARTRVFKYDVQTGKQIDEIVGSKEYEHIRCLLLADGGQTLISHGTDKTLRTVNLITGRERRFGPDLDGWIHSMSLSPTNDRILAIAGGTLGGIGRLEILDRWTGRRLARLHGHTAAVRSAAFTPDAARLVTASDDGTVRLWSMPQADPQRGRIGHIEPVTSVATTADGSTTFTGSPDGTVRIWNSTTGKQTGLLELNAVVNDLDLSLDDDSLVIATGEPDPQIRLVDATTLETKEIIRQQQSVSAVTFRKDARQVAFTRTRSVVLLDLQTGLAEYTVEPHSGSIRSLAASNDGRWLVSASADYSIALIDTATGTTARRFRGHLDEVLDVSFSPDASLLASASKDGTLRLWKTDSAELLTTLYPYRGATYAVNTTAFSPDGTIVFSGSDGSHGRGRIRAWNTTDFKEALCLQPATHIVRSLTFSENGNNMVAGNEDGTATVWDFPGSLKAREQTIADRVDLARPNGPRDLRNDVNGFRNWFVENKLKKSGVLTHGKVIATLGKRSDVWSVAWSPDGDRIASGGFRQVQFIASETREASGPVLEHGSFAYVTAFSRTGSQFASAEGDFSGGVIKRRPNRFLNLLPRKSTSEVRRIPMIRGKAENEGDHLGDDNDAGEMIWLDDDRLLLIDGCPMGRPDEIQLRSVSDGKFLDSWLANRNERYASAAISPDQQIVALGGGDYFRLYPGEISLLNAKTGQLLVRLKGHTMPVTGLFFMLDGKTLVSVSVDMTIRLWDVATASLKQVLEVTSPVGRAVLHPDGSRFCLSCFDGTVRIWETKTWQEVARLPRTPDFEPATMHRMNYGAERSGEINGLTFSPDGNTLLVGWGNRKGHGCLVFWDGLPVQRFPGHDADALQIKDQTEAEQERQQSLNRKLAELDRRREVGTIDDAVWYRGRSLLSAEEFTLDDFDIDCLSHFESALSGESAWKELPDQLAAVEPLKVRQYWLHFRDSPARLAQIRLQQREKFLRSIRSLDLEDFAEAMEALHLVEWILRIDPEHAESLELRSKIEALHPPKRLTSSVGIELVEIRPGQFNMGSRLSEPERKLDELIHPVRITAPFLMGLHEVTHGQFAEFVADTKYQTQAERDAVVFTVKGGMPQAAENLTWQSPGFETSGKQPVVCVTRDDALKFCDWLSKKDSRQYSLPTEAQWEYACRAKTIHVRFWGDSIADGRDYCVASVFKTELSAPQSVGSCQPNPFGLFDMLGNVQELCLSRYGEYPSLLVENPIHHGTNDRSSLRGGSWSSPSSKLRAASRGFIPFNTARTDVGFRVVCKPD